jgi:hypothetical protein
MADAQALREIAHSKTPFSAWLGVVILFALFGVIVLVIVGPSPRGDKYEEKRAQEREKKLQDLRKQDAAALTSYGWVDKQKGVARIPIERAMEIMVTELAGKKPTVAGPIATPAPAPPSTAAAGVATPPAAATPPSSPAPTSTGTPIEGHKSVAQPVGEKNPPNAAPGTQPGASASPAASAPPSAVAPASPSPVNSSTPPGTPLPVRGASPNNP